MNCFNLNINGVLKNFKTPVIMGILNLTPDSFYDGGKYKNVYEVEKRIEQMVEEGVEIIDVGGCSSRPNSLPINEDEEKERVIPIIKQINKFYPNIPVSVDTYSVEVAKEALENGASIINDISGGGKNNEMLNFVLEVKKPYILTHIQGIPKDMQKNPTYNDVTNDIFYWFSEKLNYLKKSGLPDIIIDVGFGFGKTLEHNYELVKHFEIFKKFELPILVGISRKSMIYNLLKTTPTNSLNGTTILNTLLISKGANIIRIHDIKEAMELKKIFLKLNDV